ncbi:BPTI/Kunitz domain-containing protein-like [Gigantopelta aegis]|uniref:BPTI/Kunitz domain-containing protein-like n=1 Tax=Gigantopelta aegis TaxID=1735272 RepID=UPI001B88E283|nr:BPTI/Kunitz domain-containing protein-like [Gigantopelta aegis]
MMYYSTGLLFVICVAVICSNSPAATNACPVRYTIFQFINNEMVCPKGTTCKQFCVSSNSVCKDPLKIGPCRAAIPRFYYNSLTNTCESFSWGGCQPNGNNFKTFVECFLTCLDTMNYRTEVLLAICIAAICICCQGCTEPRKVGPCKAAFPRFYYNRLSETCEEFTWGGCQANGNNFKTRAECITQCVI